MARVAGRVAVAAVVVATPVLTAAAAMASPVPEMATPVVAGPGIVQADYDDWYYWHCQVQHEWWRPRCHPGAPVQPGGPMLPSTGSA